MRTIVIAALALLAACPPNEGPSGGSETQGSTSLPEACSDGEEVVLADCVATTHSETPTNSSGTTEASSTSGTDEQSGSGGSTESETGTSTSSSGTGEESTTGSESEGGESSSTTGSKEEPTEK